MKNTYLKITIIKIEIFSSRKVLVKIKTTMIPVKEILINT